MRRPIADEGEARDNFGTTTYSKGQGVVRTIESFVGEDVFRDAMQRYMKEHAHGNATAADFLRAVSTEAGRDIAPAFSTFLDQPGVPVIIFGQQNG